MAVYIVGDYIRENRIRKNYSQEDLSFGICTASTLSRIENGEQTPSKRKVDKLLERLGIEDNVFTTFASKEEFELYTLIRDMSRNISDGNVEVVSKQIELLEKTKLKKGESEKQYLLWAKAVVLRRNGGTAEDVISLLLRAIHITLQEFDGKTPLEKKLLTYDEILIINGLAVQYSKQGNIADALRLGFWLKEYMEKRIMDGKLKATKYPVIVFDLSNWLAKEARFDDILKITTEGIDFCIKYGNLPMLPLLLFNKACALAELEQREEARKYFNQSIVIFETTNQLDKANMAIDWCKSNYKIDV